MDRYYLTSAIPYVNAAPHIGHAQEFVYADVVKRFQKFLGKDVLYLCGADENALKIVQAAEAAGKNPQEFTDIHQTEFVTLAEKLNIHFDVWQRGTDTSHHKSSEALWELCFKNGDIYKKTYSGLYCVGCEAFYTEEELGENGECLEHPGKKLEKVSEENYFFRLSKYQDFLYNLVATDELRITPETKKREVLAFIKGGLVDFSVSRSRERAKGWGVPVPGDEGQIMYVWFDALNIYQSGIGFGTDEGLYKKWWPADLHVIGKGIIRFHAVYWPSILKSAGLLLPKEIFVHGYLTVDGAKMSKTVGNVVDPFSVIEKYGADAVRYYLLREIPSYADGDYSERRFIEVYNSDLANGLGNLISRVAKMGEGLKFNPPAGGSEDQKLSFSDGYKRLIESYQFDEVIKTLWEEIRNTDKYINEKEPWKIMDDVEKTHVLQSAVNVIRKIGFELAPFLPETAEKIQKQFAGDEIKQAEIYFPRI